MMALRKGGHRDLERLYAAIEMDFDKRELLPKLTIHKAMSRGDQELLIVYDEESKIEVAYALCLCRGLSPLPDLLQDPGRALLHRLRRGQRHRNSLPPGGGALSDSAPRGGKDHLQRGPL